MVEVTSGQTTSVTVRIGGMAAAASPAPAPDGAADGAADGQDEANGVTSQLGSGHGE
jgi:hypothetical protein